MGHGGRGVLHSAEPADYYAVDMQNFGITSIEFWAREHMMPLFWLTDPRHTAVGDGTLFLYKDEVVHCYYVNERIEQEHTKGRDYFSHDGAFEKYSADAEVLMGKMMDIQRACQEDALPTLSNEGLFVQFDRFLGMLGEFSELYTKTEAEALKTFEDAQDDDVQRALFAAGKVRLSLRGAVESFFGVFLGILVPYITQRFSMQEDDPFFYTYQEMCNVVSGEKLDANILQDRKSGYALLNIRNTSQLLTGDSFGEIWKLVQSMTVITGSELKGRGVHPGTVRGIVELVSHNSANLSQKVAAFVEGHILVTEMTTPGTILACRKASAIITDEGGVLCHAAIISRELGKPCIVGTKVATQVLKDGDEVEIDAEGGIIRILL